MKFNDLLVISMKRREGSLVQQLGSKSKNLIHLKRSTMRLSLLKVDIIVHDSLEDFQKKTICLCNFYI